MKPRHLMATAAASTLLALSAVTSAAPAQAATTSAPSGVVAQHAGLRAADGQTCGVYGFGPLDPVLNLVYSLLNFVHGGPC
ncbi:hypothetical protein [Streptomyces melanogenes]|uniref:hypothetical protein n=1 Tax=Streptomyces melanogenes TaxID=67326 RepID=UPI00167C9CA4|nr:hypothetical protein [Streptomyces melanogenes]GGP90784.1 hypothetical protein GCM10010278_81400 [Streptomyces melanogenes]